MIRNALRRYACYVLASLLDLLFPCTDPRDAPTVRLPWRFRVRRRRRVFPGDHVAAPPDQDAVDESPTPPCVLSSPER
jgi:hypothetical protein